MSPALKRLEVTYTFGPISSQLSEHRRSELLLLNENCGKLAQGNSDLMVERARSILLITVSDREICLLNHCIQLACRNRIPGSMN